MGSMGPAGLAHPEVPRCSDSSRQARWLWAGRACLQGGQPLQDRRRKAGCQPGRALLATDRGCQALGWLGDWLEAGLRPDSRSAQPTGLRAARSSSKDACSLHPLDVRAGVGALAARGGAQVGLELKQLVKALPMVIAAVVGTPRRAERRPDRVGRRSIRYRLFNGRCRRPGRLADCRRLDRRWGPAVRRGGCTAGPPGGGGS